MSGQSIEGSVAWKDHLSSLSSRRWPKDVECRSSWTCNKHSVREREREREKRKEWMYCCFVLVPAEIVSIRENQGVREFYIHYVHFNRRLDEWVKIDRLNLKELAPPSSSSSNQSCQEMSISTPSSRAMSSSTASSSEPPSGNTTTFFLSDDAEMLNSDLSQTANLSSLTEFLPPAATSIPPTKTRGNGNNHHGGAHSVTKVKNIELIHLGRYFIKPWYFSPYPEVRQTSSGIFALESSFDLSGIDRLSRGLHL